MSTPREERSCPGSVSRASRRGLRIRETTVYRDGYAGIRILYRGSVLCIDTLETSCCDTILYTHPHPDHFPGREVLEGLVDRVYSVFYGNRLVYEREYLLGEELRVRPTHAYSWRDPDHHPRGSGSGFLIETDARVYVTGDTDLVQELLGVGRGVDLLILPIEGRGVFTPEEAVELVRSLRPAVTVPIHYREKKSFYVFRDIAYIYTQVVGL